MVACVLATLLQLVLMGEGSTAPAFMWSPHVDRTLEEAVNYQTISTEDLAKSLLLQGGWSDFVCAGKSLKQPIDAALVFIGKELHSLDVGSKNKASLVNFLKNSFTKSNFSLSFPYVAVTEEKGTMEDSLLAKFQDTCENGLGVNVVFMGSCSVEGKEQKEVAELDSVVSRLEKGTKNLVVYCSGDTNPLTIGLDQSHSESGIISNVISSLEKSGLKYAALYVSDTFNPIQYPSSHDINRFLAESSGNSSAESLTLCDEVCQMKRNLLEAVFVALVLLIILISGLCCMMGIDTPTRFEAPQESS